MSNKNNPPHYENPPLVEVVAGAQFEDLKGFKTAHVGKLWEKLGEKNYPIEKMEEVLPLLKMNQPANFAIVQSDTPPDIRYWFTHKDDDILLQFQRNRLIYNWRKYHDNNAKYPRYESVIKGFYDYHKKANSCFNDLNIAIPEIEMLELSYINLIPLNDLENNLENISLLSNDLTWSKKEHLPSPAAINARWSFALNDLKSNMSISISSAEREGTPVIKIELAIRGAAPDKDIKNCQNWFDESNKQLRWSFYEITSPEMHKKWGIKWD